MTKSKNYSRTIGVFYGSNSGQYQQSLETGKLIVRELLAIGFNVVEIFLDKNGDWNLMAGGISNASQKKYSWKLDLNIQKKFCFSSRNGINIKEYKIDIVIPAFHGLPFEGGALQGLCDLLGVSYVGCGLTTSALSIDKILTKEMLAGYGLQTLPYLYFTKSEWENSSSDLFEAIMNTTGLPAYVKPARSGASIGVSLVNNISDLDDALESAFIIDDKVLIEKAVLEAQSLTVAITGNYFNNSELLTSKVVIQNSDGNKVLFNANDSVLNSIIELAKRVYVSLEATGTASIDIIRNPKSGEISVTEIDTMPHYVAMDIWELTDVSPSILLRELIRLADEKIRYSDLVKKT